MLKWQAVVKDADGKVIDTSETYVGTTYFMETVALLMRHIPEGGEVVVKRVAGEG